MAQLPPKVPNMVPNWADFSHQKLLLSSVSPLENLGANPATHHHHHNHNNPSWVDEFLDFSSAKRGCHRRSISDSIAFLEVPAAHVLVEECRRSSTGGGVIGNGGGSEVDKFDDEQQLIMSMFTADDDIINANANANVNTNNNNNNNNMSCSNPSSPSDDRNSINDDDDHKQNPLDLRMLHHHLKSEPADQEVDQSSSKSDHDHEQPPSDHSNDKIVDPKRIKRCILSLSI